MKLLKSMRRLFIHRALVLNPFHWYRFHPFDLSISPALWYICQESVFIQMHLSKACWGIWLCDNQNHPDYNGQRQKALQWLDLKIGRHDDSSNDSHQETCPLASRCTWALFDRMSQNESPLNTTNCQLNPYGILNTGALNKMVDLLQTTF